jgi:opacity protein-like surface antigen
MFMPVIKGTLGNDYLVATSPKGDTVYGGPGFDTLESGPGADYLDGGGNEFDQVSYQGSNAGVYVNLKTGETSGGFAEGDTIVGVKNLIGSNFGDTLIGDADVNLLRGMDGNDLLEGGGGTDILSGGDGNDKLFGGDDGDLLFGGYGADVLNGGAGIDTVSYWEGNPRVNSVTVNLMIGGGSGGTAQGDTYSSIENVIGTPKDDVIIGNDEANALYGWDGSDTLTGNGGADHFIFSGKSIGLLGADAPVITDFSQNDVIDFANPHLGGNLVPAVEVSTFIGQSDFTGSPGELRYEHVGGNTILSFDKDGDASGLPDQVPGHDQLRGRRLPVLALAGASLDACIDAAADTLASVAFRPQARATIVVRVSARTVRRKKTRALREGNRNEEIETHWLGVQLQWSSRTRRSRRSARDCWIENREWVMRSAEHGGFLASALVAIGSLAAMPASAADLPAKAPVLRATPAAVNWTGFYVGANAGYAWGKTDVRASATPAFGPEFQDYFNSNGTFGLRPKGFVGGAQAGFNYQTGVWVYGLEADVQSFNATASRDTGIIAAPVGQTGGFQDKFDTSWLVTIRPRLGVTIDRALIYATGGMAIAELKLSQQSSICSSGLCLAHLDGAASSTKVGWVVGGGVEHALTGNWSVKAEYLYVDFGTMGLRRFFVDITGVHPEFFIDNTANLRAHIARFGVNYKFYSDGPTIAKY